MPKRRSRESPKERKGSADLTDDDRKKKKPNRKASEDVVWVIDTTLTPEDDDSDDSTYVPDEDELPGYEEFLKHILGNIQVEEAKPKRKRKPAKGDVDPAIKLTPKEKAYFDFCFAFGYMTIKEQYEFMKFLIYLIENKFTNIYRRDGKSSIIETLYIKTGYYHLNQVEAKDTKYHRLSIYEPDKSVIMNLCKLVSENSLNISGVYQPNTHSFWFPKIIINRIQNIEEYILFNSYENLSFVETIE